MAGFDKVQTALTIMLAAEERWYEAEDEVTRRLDYYHTTADAFDAAVKEFVRPYKITQYFGQLIKLIDEKGNVLCSAMSNKALWQQISDWVADGTWKTG